MDSNEPTSAHVEGVCGNPREPEVTVPSRAITQTPNTSAPTLITQAATIEPNTPSIPTVSGQHPFLLVPAATNTSSSRAPSVHNAVLARRNILTHIRNNYRAISRTNRIMLIVNSLFTFSLLIAIVAVLIISRNQGCDRPLHVFLVFHAIKCGLSIPLMLVHYLHPDGRYPQFSSSMWVQWADRIKSLLDFVGTFMFILGNYFLFTSITCESTAPSLFGMSLVMVVLGYFMVAIPVLLCGAAVFCLPCALVVMRVFHIGPNNDTGAKPEEIKSITLLKYRHGSTNLPVDSSISIPSVNSNVAPSKLKFLRKLKSKLSRQKKYRVEEFVNMNQIKDLPELRVADPEDAMCSVCLEEYNDGELVRKLRCNHHFHQHCLDEWLLINKYCPLCKANACPTTDDNQENA